MDKEVVVSGHARKDELQKIIEKFLSWASSNGYTQDMEPREVRHIAKRYAEVMFDS